MPPQLLLSNSSAIFSWQKRPYRISHSTKEEELKNTRPIAFRKSHTLCHHSKMADRMLRHPRWWADIGYKNGRPDVTSSTMADRIWRHPRWPTGCDVRGLDTSCVFYPTLNGKLRTHAFFMRTANTDQIERMPRLIPVFLGPKFIVFVLSCCDKGLWQILRVFGEEKEHKISL